MRGLSCLLGLAVLASAAPVVAPQGKAFSEGVWIELGGSEEPHGLALRTPDDRCRRLEAAGRPCRATDHANGGYSLAFETDPDFRIEGRDTISVIVEYLDNADREPIYCQCAGEAGFVNAPPILRTGTGEWKTGRWQVTDPALGRLTGGGVKVQFHADGWFGTQDLHLASVRVTHEAVRLDPQRLIVPADGKTTTPFTVDVFDVAGQPAPDGTEVLLTCTGARAPQSVLTKDGKATFNVTSGPERGTGRLDARWNEAAGRALIYQVAGEGPLLEFTHAIAAEDLRKSLRFSGREATSTTIVPAEESEDPDVVEIRLAFPPEGERARALFSTKLPIPGKPEILRLEVGSDGSLTDLNVLLGDSDGDDFLYGVYTGGRGRPLTGWHTAEIDANRLGFCEGRDMDYVPELPLAWVMLSLHFAPGTTEGVLRIRRMEADCIGTQAEAGLAGGPARERKTEPVVIPNVARIGPDAGHLCRCVSALLATLQVLGCETTYEELMVASGAAFSLAWHPGEYDYWSIENAPENLMVNGALAVGASAEVRQFATSTEAWDALCQSIDEGRPVISRQWCDPRLVYGYDPGARQLYVQSAGLQPKQPELVPLAELCVPAGPAHPATFVFLNYDAAVGTPERDWVSILQRAVRFAEWPPDQLLDGNLLFGLTAYDEWAATVAAGAGETPVRPAVALMWWWGAERVPEMRECAALVLAPLGTLHAGIAEAAQHYQATADLLRQIKQTLAGGAAPTTETAEANFDDPAIRDEAALLILQARNEEAQAVECLRGALAELAPVAGQAAAPQDDVQQHCRKARELKAQGRHAEAAEELAAAIALDPQYAEAWWVLGWVRVELKDTAGAREAFEKVIAVAPGSDLAGEAQKALARLEP